jgi:hypothetical protein
MQLTGKFQQLNASPSFSLIRFETNGPALWFKAVGEPNQREFAITLTLTRLFPLYVPCVLATRPEWNAWLTWDAEGELLSDIGETAPWRRVAADLADLQFDSIAKTTGILQSGARDLRIGALSKHLHGFVVVTQELMQRQTKSTPPVLDRERLQLLADRIAHALELLDRLQIPDALGHLDFNPGNVVVSSSRCAFLDWADAYVGNPFLTFEYLLEHFRRTHGTNSPQQSELVEVYGARWKEALSSEAIQEALAVAPLFAVFSYACGTGMLSDEKRLEDAEFAGYMRGLVRRMDREARALVDRSSKCNTQAVV